MIDEKTIVPWDKGMTAEEFDTGLHFAKQLGYSGSGVWSRYVREFKTAEGRARMADRFVAKANELGLTDVLVTYE